MNIGAISALAAIVLFFAAPAYAYVDPGTGGMLIQLVTGGVAGVMVLLRLYWTRIKSSFGKGATPAAGQNTETPRLDARE